MLIFHVTKEAIRIFHLVCVEILITLLVYLKGKTADLKKINILSFGFNMTGDYSKNDPGIHAEHDAINRLKPLHRKKHLHNVNILVIRISKNNKLQSSQPCANCIETMKRLPEKKGYRIRNIYYSNENGEILKSNLKNLEKEELHYSRFFRNKSSGISSN
jgi:hypothetical protein